MTKKEENKKEEAGDDDDENIRVRRKDLLRLLSDGLYAEALQSKASRMFFGAEEDLESKTITISFERE